MPPEGAVRGISALARWLDVALSLFRTEASTQAIFVEDGGMATVIYLRMNAFSIYVDHPPITT